MNFSRSNPGILSAISSTTKPIPNRFIAAMLATLVALVISTLGTNQWASADSGNTVPDPDPTPTIGAPRHVVARAGDESAAVAWNKPAETDHDIDIDGYVVIADPSGITVQTDDDDTLVIVEGLENGTEYTFTVVAFNEDGRGAISEPSNPVTPEEGRELDEDQLERLREHLRKLAHEASERLHKAEEKAREQLAKHQDRIDGWLDKQRMRANDHLDKKTEKAREQDQNKTDKARDWFERLKEQLAKKLERAEGTDRYDELRDRAEATLDKAEHKLVDRLEDSREQTEARIAKAEETVERRIEKAEARAENQIQRTEERLSNNVSKMKERLQDLLRRLRAHWLEQSANAG
ncbi:fibronectin type III domain-containing protein [Dehalococcoides mccartyi]|nr:fibronectin type III domain-containing protein [Dehalococcoides mccartyi]